VDSLPPSLYWDEASLGYNAFSISQTARDEHGKFLPYTNFGAFGDYKPPGYIYATVPFIAFVNVTELAVRLPSVMAGVLTVILCYYLVKKLFGKEIIALLSAFFLAISPWHLQLSRAGFEANLALFFSLSGIYFFIKFATEKKYNIYLSSIFFLLAMFTFTGQRLFVPFIVLILAIAFRQKIVANPKIVILNSVLALIAFWPLFVFSTQTIEGKLRFDEVSIFKNLKPINDSIRFRETDNFSSFSGIIHNRRLFFARDYLKHYFDAYNPSFLFINGDANPRLSIQSQGQLYIFDLVFLLLGLYFLFRKNYKYKFLLLGWLLVSPLGPATARETPHALRMIHILPTFQIISAIGLYHLISNFQKKYYVIYTSVLVISISLLYYLHMYYIHYPIEYSGEWQYGYKQTVEYIESKYNEVDNIVVTKHLGRPYIYYLLYMKFPPANYWSNAVVTRDKFFFYDVESFDKFYFVSNPDEFDKRGNNLYVTSVNNLPKDTKLLKTVKNLSGDDVFVIGEKNI